MKTSTQKKLLTLLRMPKHELHSAIKEHVEWRETHEQTISTLRNLKVWYKKFRAFLYQYDTRNISLTNQGIGKDYVEWMEGTGVANSYIIGHFKTFLATINRLGIYHDFNRKELFRGYAKESKANEDFFLTDEEVKQLLGLTLYEMKGIILDRFIVSCFTGCRRSEITSVEILDDNTLRYTSMKTKKDILVPFNAIVKPYIESGRFRTNLKDVEEQQLNVVLQAILKKLKWNDPVKKYRLIGKKKQMSVIKRYKAITFHSARKFFGKMLLDRDVSMYKVSQLLGHASIDTTQKYYAALTRDKMINEANQLISNF